MARRGRGYPVRSCWTAPAVATAPPPAEGDLPPVPVVAHAVELIESRPKVFVEWLPLEPPAAPTGTPSKPVVVQQQPLPLQLPNVSVERTPIEATVPLRPDVVGAQPLPIVQPFVQIGSARAEPIVDTTKPRPSVVVRATELSVAAVTGQIFTITPRSEPPAAAPQVPIKSTVVTSEPPITAPMVGHVGFSVDSGIVSAVSPRPTVVAAQQFLSQPFISVAPTKTEPPPPVPTVPPRPTVTAAQQFLSQPFISVALREAEPPAPGPAVRVCSTIVTSEPPIAAPMIGHVGFSVDSGIAPAGPTVPPRPTIIASAGPTPPPVDQVMLWAQVMVETPTRPLVIPAQTPLVAPFVFVNKPKAFDVAPPDPQVPIKPVVVRAQPLPPQTQAPFRFHSRVDPPPPPPSVPIRPTIVNAQPLPPQVQPPTVARTFYEEPKTPTKSLFVAGQQLPPQPAFILTPKGGRWGNPPPNHRVIQPTVNVDMSLPFRPYGSARMGHGFAEALPLLGEGAIVGGTMEGPLLSGGILTGSGMGGTIQNGYVTGGVR